MPEEQKPRLKLYHASPSRSSIVLWMLEELGEPYAIELLDLKKGDQHNPQYLAINPMGKVPALDDGGTIITEVSAICCYLADTFPKAGLAPPIGDTDRGPYLKWLFYGPSCVWSIMRNTAPRRDRWPAGPTTIPCSACCAKPSPRVRICWAIDSAQPTW
jgi:glutathione S-transferase